MSERDADESDLEWASVMEECKRELSCVCQKMAQAAGWQPGRPYRPHAPEPGEQRVEMFHWQKILQRERLNNGFF